MARAAQGGGRGEGALARAQQGAGRFAVAVTMPHPAPRRTLLEALDARVRGSVGLAPAHGPRLSSDLREANARAEARRALAEFEARLEGEGSALIEGSDCDEEEARAPRADLDWSDEAPELDRLAKSTRTRQFAQLDKVVAMVQTLRLGGMGITELDAGTRSLVKLRELTVSGNELEEIANLPAGLVSLQAYGCRVSRLDLQGCPAAARSLLHLGLGYNALCVVGSWVEDLSSLASLDLCYNAITDLGAALGLLQTLRGSLRVLHLHGNPCALTPGYRARVLAALPGLALLDGLPVSPGETASAASAAGARGSLAMAEGSDLVTVEIALLGATIVQRAPPSGLSEAALAAWSERQRQRQAVLRVEAQLGGKDVLPGTLVPLAPWGAPAPRAPEPAAPVAGKGAAAAKGKGAAATAAAAALAATAAAAATSSTAEDAAAGPLTLKIEARHALGLPATTVLRDAVEGAGLQVRLVLEERQADGAEPTRWVLSEGALELCDLLDPAADSKLVTTTTTVRLECPRASLLADQPAAPGAIELPKHERFQAEGSELVLSLAINTNLNSS